MTSLNPSNANAASNNGGGIVRNELEEINIQTNRVQDQVSWSFFFLLLAVDVKLMK